MQTVLQWLYLYGWLMGYSKDLRIRVKNDYYSCAVGQWRINEEGQVWDLSVSCVGTWNVTPSGYTRREKSWPFALLFLRLD